MAEQDYAGGAGYATKQEPFTAEDKYDAQDALAQARQDRVILPAGRALDELDLEEMLDPSNQTSRANILRDRLARWAAGQLRQRLVLDERELRVLKLHHLGLTPDGDAYAYALRHTKTAGQVATPLQGRTVVTRAQPYQPEISEWP